MKRINKLYLFLVANLTVSLAIAQPSSPEVSAFTPIGQTEMVDLATGDFSYNIPLMEIGGYPINLGYNAGAQMDQEASMVGLGWTLNAGAITRTMRGLPDDFKGDEIVTTTSMLPDTTKSVNLGMSYELFGHKPPEGMIEKIKAFTNSTELKGATGISLGVEYNNKTGYSFMWSVSPELNISRTGIFTNGSQYDLGLNLSKNSSSPSASTSISPRASIRSNTFPELNIGTTASTLQGITSLSFSSSSLGVFNQVLNLGISSLFSSKSYQPFSPYESKTKISTKVVDLGPTLTGLFGSPSLTTTSVTSELVYNGTPSGTKSYGYLYLSSATQKDLIDLNREKEIGYIKECPNLSVPALTNDVFNASAHGVSGSFRAFRNDVGILFDPILNSKSYSETINSQIGVGADGSKISVDPSLTWSNESVNRWEKKNEFYPDYDFTTANSNNPLYEEVYFKNLGESAIMSDELFNQLGGFDPIQVEIINPKSTGDEFIVDDNQSISKNISSNANRAKRGQVFSYLTADEASIPGAVLNAQLEYVDENYLVGNNLVSEVNRNSEFRKGHHISHCKVLNTDGMRYNYSLPVYNTRYEEVSFNTCEVDEDGDGLVEYVPGSANSPLNTCGIDHFYEKKETPPYAHSYMLTSVLSPNYSDLTGDGISSDDIGQAVKFNYFKVEGNLAENYKCRFPYEENKANLNGGLEHKINDNKANYVYGEKEIVIYNQSKAKLKLQFFTILAEWMAKALKVRMVGKMIPE